MPNYVKQIIKFKNEEDLELIVQKYCVNLDENGNQLESNDENGELTFDFNKIKEMPIELDVENSSTGKSGFAYLNDPILYILNHTDDKYFQNMLKNFTPIKISKLEMNEIQTIIEDNKEEIKKINYFDLILGQKYKDNIENYGASDWYDWRVANWGTKWNSCNTNINKEELYIAFETAWDIAEPIIFKMILDNDIKEIDLYFADEGCSFCGKTTISKNENDLIDCINFDISEEFEQNFVDSTFSENLESLEDLINSQNNIEIV